MNLSGGEHVRGYSETALRQLVLSGGMDVHGDLGTALGPLVLSGGVDVHGDLGTALGPLVLSGEGQVVRGDPEAALRSVSLYFIKCDLLQHI